MEFSEFYSLYCSGTMISVESILIRRYDLYYNFGYLQNFGKNTIERFCKRNNLGLDVGQMYFTVYVAPSFAWSKIEQPRELLHQLIKETYVREIGRELPDDFILKDTQAFTF